MVVSDKIAFPVRWNSVSLFQSNRVLSSNIMSLIIIDANVPLRYKKNRKLGKWVSHQRTTCARKDRVAKLDGLGFVWNGTSLTTRKRQLDSTERRNNSASDGVDPQTAPAAPAKAPLAADTEAPAETINKKAKILTAV